MSYRRLTKPERLLFINDAIQIILRDPVLSDAFATVGYTPQRLSEASLLEERARTLWYRRQVEYGIRLESTGAMLELERFVATNLRKDRQLARVVLDASPGLYEKLRLNGAIERKRDRMVLQALHFYGESINMVDIQSQLAGVGLSLEVLQERQGSVSSLNEAMQRQQHQSGEAIIATKESQDAMDVLDRWVLQFLAIARAIFKEDEEQLHKLGMPL